MGVGMREAIKEMKKLQGTEKDIEISHQLADDLLCPMLRANGYDELVDEYYKVEKWYA